MAISEPAVRYIGDAIVSVVLEDDDSYSGVVLAGDKSWQFDKLHGPAAGFGRGVAWDSAVAYDRMAASAVSFGSYYTTHNRGDDLPSWAPPAEIADAIDQAVSWAQDDKGNYDVRRAPLSGGPAVHNRLRARKNEGEFYMIDDFQLKVLVRISNRLFTGARMSAADMRDEAHKIALIVRACRQLEVPR